MPRVISFLILLFASLCLLLPFSLPVFLLTLRLRAVDRKWYVAKHENWGTWIFWCFWRSGPNTIWRKTSQVFTATWQGRLFQNDHFQFSSDGPIYIIYIETSVTEIGKFSHIWPQCMVDIFQFHYIIR